MHCSSDNHTVTFALHLFAIVFLSVLNLLLFLNGSNECMIHNIMMLTMVKTSKSHIIDIKLWP